MNCGPVVKKNANKKDAHKKKDEVIISEEEEFYQVENSVESSGNKKIISIEDQYVDSSIPQKRKVSEHKAKSTVIDGKANIAEESNHIKKSQGYLNTTMSTMSISNIKPITQMDKDAGIMESTQVGDNDNNVLKACVEKLAKIELKRLMIIEKELDEILNGKQDLALFEKISSFKNEESLRFIEKLQQFSKN